MEEHKLLTGMLLVALVVSIVGTVISVDRIASINGGTDLTASAVGTADIVEDVALEVEEAEEIVAEEIEEDSEVLE